MHDTRRDRLKLLLTEISAAKLASMSGVDATLLSRYKTGRKQMSEGTARRLEAAARKPERWMDLQHAPAGDGPRSRTVAQVLSQPIVSDGIPRIQWERIMDTQRPTLFRAALPDDAMGPEYPKGTELVWSTKQRMIPGRVVLVRDQHGQVHARECRQGLAAGEWSAAPRNAAYVTFPGSSVQLLAVSRGRLDPEDE